MPINDLNIQPRKTAPKAGHTNALFQRQEQLAVATTPPATDPNNAPPAEMTDGNGAFVEPAAALAKPEATPEATKRKPGRPPAVKPPVDEKAKVVSSERNGKVIQPSQPPAPKPPSTRQEYRQQQQPFNPSYYPEVQDVFTGKVAGQVPASGVVQFQPTAPQPQAPQVVQHVITHELPDQAQAYQFTRDYGGHIGGAVYRQFFKGDIIYETHLIDDLLRAGCDAIIPHSTAENFLTCPTCKHTGPEQVFKRLK